MAQTNFTPKLSGDKLYAEEYMQITEAINNIESALNMDVGTSSAQIPGSNLASGIDANKLNPLSSGKLLGLEITNLQVNGPISLGNNGYLSILNGHETLRIGPKTLVANDGSRNTLHIKNDGSATFRGVIDADTGSTFRGALFVSSGNIFGSLNIGGPTGITMDGEEKSIKVNSEGNIEFGESHIDSTGIHIKDGSISITDDNDSLFYVSSDGSLTAIGADITGTISAVSGTIGGILIDTSGIHVGGAGQSTEGFSLNSSGYLYVKKGSFTGHIVAQTGSLGNMSVTGEILGSGYTIGPNRIDITSGSINLGSGNFLVNNSGQVTITNGQINGHMTIQSGSVTGEFSAGSVTMSPDGLRVDGPGGVIVDSGSIEIWSPGDTPVRIITLGKYGSEHGMEVRNASNQVTFKVSDSGDVSMRGSVHAVDGVFDGEVNARSGSFKNIDVDGEIRVAQDGYIKAGTSIIDSDGIHLTEGNISLGNRFSVDSTGRLSASNAYVSGKISASDGDFTGIVTIGARTDNFHDQLRIDGTDGTIRAGQTVIGRNGISISEGSINLGMGDFLVDSHGTLVANRATIRGHISVESANILGTMVTSGALIDQQGIRVIGSQGLKVLGGSISVINTDSEEVVRVGQYTTDDNEIERGIAVYRDNEITFQVSSDGSTAIKGLVHAEGGSFDGLLTVSEDGVIRAGEEDGARVELTKDGLLAYDNENQMTIQIDSETGKLIAVGAEIYGEVTALVGKFEGPVTIEGDGSFIAGPVNLNEDGVFGPGFSLDTDGVKAIQGLIGGWSIGGDNLSAGDLLISAEPGEEKISSPRFSLDKDGVFATGGSIAGWAINQNSIKSGNIDMKSSGRIEVSNDGNETELVIGELDDNTYGLYANGIKLNSEGLSSDKFTMNSDGEFQALKGVFGEEYYKLVLDDRGIFSGGMPDPDIPGEGDSPFGIYTQTVRDKWNNVVAEAGSAYFKGAVTVSQDSIIGDGVSTANIAISKGGSITIGDVNGPHIEMIGPDGDSVPGGIYAYRRNEQTQQLEPSLSINARTGDVKVTGEINALEGRFGGNVLIGPGMNIRIIGDPSHPSVSGFAGGIPGIYLMEQGQSGGMIRLVADTEANGIQYSPDGGQSWIPAITAKGVNPESITDGNLLIRDTGGASNGIIIQRRSTFENISLPTSPTGWAPIGHRYVTVIQVTSLDGETIYNEFDEDTQQGDYVVNSDDGFIRRSSGSSIPIGATVKVTYDWNIIDINSHDGIKIHEGNIEIVNPETGSTIIGGGYVYVNSLDVGVFQSDNFIRNGDFCEPSSAYGTINTEENRSIPGFDAYEPNENNEWGPFYGDWMMDREGRIYKYGAAAWIPSKSETTYDEHGNVTGYAQVAFAPGSFLHNIHGYAVITVEGTTEQWGQIEQDIFPYFNHSDGYETIPAESWEQVVISAGFHWHGYHSDDNIIEMEVDELIPHYVFVESTQTEKFTPEWDNVHEEQNGIRYFNSQGVEGEGWTFEDNHDYGTGDNLAWGASIDSNAQIVDGTRDYVVDNLFVREEFATKTVGTGYHCIELELKDDPVTKEAPIINQIWVWHSKDRQRVYKDHKIEVSVDGQNWTTVFDTTDPTRDDHPWHESPDGKKFNFDPMQVKYIRDWINGYDKEVVEGGQVVNVGEDNNQWMEIQVRRCMYAITHEPGSYYEWTFTPHSNVDLWLGFNAGPGRGIGKVEIDGKRVGTINQEIGGHGSHDSDDDHHHEHGDPEFGIMHDDHHGHYSLSYADISSQEENGIIPRKEVTVRVTFDDEVPENHGKSFSFNRIKLEDFRREGDLYTTRIPVANANFHPVNPYAFYKAYALPSRAKNYIGMGRQIIRGMWDTPSNFSPACNCWLRYRVRIRSMRLDGSSPNTHDHVMISHVVMEKGGKPTHFRRSSLDRIPTHLIPPWDPNAPAITGIQGHHLADDAVTAPKIMEKSISTDHIDSIHVDKIEFESGQLHTHDNKNVLDQISGMGSSGSSTEVARADHNHDERYLQVDGNGEINGDLIVHGEIIESGKYNEVHRRPVFGIAGDLEFETYSNSWQELTQSYGLFKGYGLPDPGQDSDRYYRIYMIWADNILGESPEPPSLTAQIRFVDTSTNQAVYTWNMPNTGIDNHDSRRDGFSPFFQVQNNNNIRIEARIRDNTGALGRWLEIHYVELIAYDVY